MGGMQSAVTPNFTELYSEQSQHIAYIVAEARRRNLRTFEASGQAESAWVQTIGGFAASNRDFALGCTPGYYNNEGRPGEGPGWFGGNYAGSAPEFFKMLREWRTEGTLAGLELD